MSYAQLTRQDRNPLKRWLQRRRLQDALSLVPPCTTYQTIIDFGAGDGELCKHVASRFPHARIFCYEPCPALREEAIRNLQDISRVVVVAGLHELPLGECDLLLCMEVFEHLPPAQTDEALRIIQRLLRPEGAALIGVPLEVFVPALLKGAFRMTRRWGEFDARPLNVLRAALGRPPRDRPLSEISPGLHYHFHHMGFDHRRLRRQLAARFAVQEVSGSPLPRLRSLINSELYYLVRKAAQRTPVAAAPGSPSSFMLHPSSLLTSSPAACGRRDNASS